METQAASALADSVARPADFGPVPVSRLKADSGDVFRALEEGFDTGLTIEHLLVRWRQRRAVDVTYPT